MKKNDRIAFMIQRTKTAVAISSFLFLLSSLIDDLNMGGIYSTSGYSVTKMALGSLGIGLGFGIPCIIYTNEKLSRSVQISVHMVTGCTLMLAILSMLLTAFIIAGLTYRRQKKLAERINRELEQRRS